MALDSSPSIEAQALLSLGAFLHFLEREPTRFPLLSRRLRQKGALDVMALQEATTAFHVRPQVLRDFEGFEDAIKAQVPESLRREDWTVARVECLLQRLEQAGMRTLATSLRSLVVSPDSPVLGFGAGSVKLA